MNENEKIGKYLDFVRELKKLVEQEGDSDTINSWNPWNGFQNAKKGNC